jgi:ribosome biogenesis protein BRX1
LDKEDISLVEIGPRFCLTPIRIFEGSFGGPTVFENPEFVHPNFVRSSLRKDKLQKYSNRQKNMTERDARIKMAEESRETEASDKRVFK